MAKAAKKAKLDPQGLTALGLERLIGIVLDEAALNPSFKKRVSAALAGVGGALGMAKLIDTRLASLEKARTRIRWQRERAFANDLESILASIVREFAAVDPAMAIERLVRFVLGYDVVCDRVNDSSGRIAAVYGKACEAAGALAQAVPAAQQAAIPPLFAGELHGIDYYGFRTWLAVEIVPRLAPEILAAWDETLTGDMKISAQTTVVPAIVAVRRAIADARGDVDRYVAIEETLPESLQEPAIVAERLLAAGRHEEALVWVRRPRRPRVGFFRRADMLRGALHALPDTEKLEAAILDGLKDRSAAQALRWKAFERTLDPEKLRDYIAKTGDFEEFEALDKAFALVDGQEDPWAALRFYLAWPRLDRAARYVVAKTGRWSGDEEDLLAAAQALEPHHPEAATVLYRALLDPILKSGMSQSYPDGAGYLVALSRMADRLGDDAGLMPHSKYLAALRKDHARRSAFWSLVAKDLDRAR